MMPSGYFVWIYASLIVTILPAIIIPCMGQDCRKPLGMQNKTIIPDSYITATSSHASGTGPQYARLHSQEGDGAWCPRDVVEPGSQDKYLQIKLPHAVFITRIATQGRYGGGVGKEFARNYMVNYSRDGVSWFQWSNHKGVKILQGNSDVSSVKIHALYPGIAGANYVRIIPVTSRLMPVCLRLELYGCAWRTGLVSYSIPSPDHPPSALHMFSDETYDGERSVEFFTGGLGQLADKIVGDGDVTKTESRFLTNATGYDYVGWSQKKGKKVEMEFCFDQVRNFTSMRVYCNTNKAVGARLFSSIQVRSSFDGRAYTKIEGRMMSQTTVTYFTTRVIYVPLRHQLARALKVEFEMGKGRLLISEIKFTNKLLPPDVVSRIAAQHPWVGEGKVIVSPSSKSHDGSYVTIIVGILGGLIFFLLVLALVLYFRQRKLRKTLSSSLSFTFRAGSSRYDNIINHSPRPPLPTRAPTTKHTNPIYHEIAPSPSCVTYLEPITATGGSPPPPYQAAARPSPSSPSSLDWKPLKASHYAEADIFVSNFTSQGLQGMSGNNIYAVPCATPSPRPSKHQPQNVAAPTLPNLHGTCRNMDDLSDNEEHSALLATFGVRPCDLPPEFPQKKLEFVETLGEGQFGEVQLCLADNSIRQLCDDEWFSLPGNSRGKLLVAVKVLHEDASESAKENFFQEVRVMSRLLHGNIVRLLAVCTETEPFSMITEYMERGDLHQYLRTFSDDLKPSPGKNFIRSEVLLKMAVQISAGMKYLASLSFVHRDLAARNCLVGASDEIRIADFGMSRNMYQSDYYRIQGRAVLPIRWMSWECVLMGVFSSSSDVWSFAVTVWEIYSLCKHQPFAALSDQEVIENMHHMFRGTGDEVFLPRPKRCPGSLFNVIRKCWRKEASARPTFDQLHVYLLERNQTCRRSPKPKRPKERPPKPKIRARKPIV